MNNRRDIPRMRKTLVLYLFLVLFFVLQLANLRIAVWFPDLTLLVLIYVSVFGRPVPAQGVIMGLFLGLIRGIFSPYLLAVDIVLFPSLAYIAYLFAKLFYWYSSIAQVFIAVFSVSIVIVVHLVSLSVISSGDMDLQFALLGQWHKVLATAVAAPFLFAFFERLTGGMRRS